MNFIPPFRVLFLFAFVFAASSCIGGGTTADNNGTGCDDGERLYNGVCERDQDNDFIVDIIDNCPLVPNYDQADSDGNGVGDLCEPDPADYDHDGVANEIDNCPNHYNPLQEDSNNNGVGDVCEPNPDDADLDGVENADDNCPYHYNPLQEDSDGDGVGDVCEPLPNDTDVDGIENSADNCPDDYNPNQEDADNDGIGDACDENTPVDTDGDGVPDASDNCPGDYNPNQADANSNGIGDACEQSHAGTLSDPFVIPVSNYGATYNDSQDTSLSGSSVIDTYPPDTLDESGPEYFYVFTLPRRMKVQAWIASPEPDGVDIDIHLLSSLSPVTLIARHNSSIYQNLDAGTYYLSLDTYAGTQNAGDYTLHFTAEPFYAGTPQDPVLFGVPSASTAVTLPVVRYDSRDTSQSTVSNISTYPPSSVNESGPEYYYAFTVDEPVYFAAELLLPEPSGVDVDVHLLSSLSPVALIERDNHKIVTSLEAGTYYVVIDTYNGIANAGEYILNITLRAQDLDPSTLFSSYIIDAVEYIDQHYALLGYDINSVLTHDVTYGPYGTIPQTGVQNKTMCVAAVMEIMLVAMELYANDTGDASVWDFLAKRSWQYLGTTDIKAHIWVNHGDIDSGGSADAYRHFGMGMNVPFEELVPGSMININRTTGSGHAVVFMAFLDSS
ncbi:thrombospondin type 3 repeat-containing protein, partial [Myxococcota bacterium]|nr:thrombospondin type 3 repeat-containing protein [Myxococcota bacterium]